MIETELPLQLRNHWFIACRSADLRTSPLGRAVLGQPLVLFRDERGTACALIDRCAHRQMPLSAGRVRSEGIECAYHGWIYRADGRCAVMPSLDEIPAVSIRSFRTFERDGYVWVYVGDGEPVAEPLPFPHHGDPGWTTFSFSTRFDAGAFFCLENFLDVPHTAYVHSGWFRSGKARDVRAIVRREVDGAVAEFEEEAERQSVVARLLFPKGRKLRHTDRFLMPSTSRVDYSFGTDRHFIITSQCTPVSAHQTDVYTVITFRYGLIAPLVRLYFQPLSKRILRQDIVLLRRLGAHHREHGGPGLRFVKSDLLGPEILRLWRAATEGHPIQPMVESVTLRF